MTRQERCEHAIVDTLEAFIKSDEGKGITSAELLRAIFDVWDRMGENFLKRNLIIK